MKDYKHRSFVVPNGVLDKLQKIADKQERSLNWLVVRILKEYCEVRDGKIDDAK